MGFGWSHSGGLRTVNPHQGRTKVQLGPIRADPLVGYTATDGRKLILSRLVAQLIQFDGGEIEVEAWKGEIRP